MITVGITAVGSGVGQAVLRSLALGDLEYRVVGMDVSALNSGMHWVDRAHVVPPWHDAAYVDRVLEICATEGVDVLIPGSDPDLEPLSAARDRFGALGCLVLAPDAVTAHLSMDKLAMHDWCVARGLRFVPTSSLADAQADAGALEYPVIIKPRSGSASQNVRLAVDAAALVELDPSPNFIVQSYLPPRGLDGVAAETEPARLDQLREISSQYILGRDGAVLGSFVTMNALRAGIPTEIVPVLDPAVIADGRAIAEALALHGATGPINLQGRIAADGRVLFFELNARFTGITGIRTMMGFREVEATIRSQVFDDDAAASASLNTLPGLIGLRHVGDLIVSNERITTIERVRPAAEERTGTVTRRAARVLVTGASGYIGRQVVTELLDGDVDGVIAATGEQSREATARLFADAERVSARVVDLFEADADLDGVDTVIHLAAVRSPQAVGVGELYRFNVEATRRLAIAAAKAGGGRFILASSQAVYGTARSPLWHESLTPAPESDYASSKWMAELATRAEVVDGLTVAVLRLGRAYGLGSGMRWSELPHAFARRTADGDPLTIHGDGSQRMDLVHVRDIARAVARAIVAPLPTGARSIVNVGGGHPISLLELARTFETEARELGLTPPAIERTPPSGTERQASFGMDIRRARAVLEWAPVETFGASVRELIAEAQRG